MATGGFVFSLAANFEAPTNRQALTILGDVNATYSAHPIVILARYSVAMQTTLTNDRAQLILEGLWDQLELAIEPLRISDEQPSAVQVALSRIIRYRIRLREVIEAVQLNAASDATAKRQLTVVLCDVLTRLDAVEMEPQSEWISLLYETQDAVLASLHHLRTSHGSNRPLTTSFSATL